MFMYTNNKNILCSKTVWFQKAHIIYICNFNVTVYKYTNTQTDNVGNY